MQRLWVGLGALAGLGAVAMAAFSAHGLGWLDPSELRMVDRSVQMQGWHAMALLTCGLWAPRGGRLTDAAGLAFGSGLILFSGAVYVRALGGISLGPLAPIGGSLLMLGWLLLAASTLRK